MHMFHPSYVIPRPNVETTQSILAFVSIVASVRLFWLCQLMQWSNPLCFIFIRCFFGSDFNILCLSGIHWCSTNWVLSGLICLNVTLNPINHARTLSVISERLSFASFLRVSMFLYLAAYENLTRHKNKFLWRNLNFLVRALARAFMTGSFIHFKHCLSSVGRY